MCDCKMLERIYMFEKLPVAIHSQKIDAGRFLVVHRILTLPITRGGISIA